MSRTPRFVMAGATDVGRAREQNEDCIATRPELGLAVLADGMGGHQAGEVASALAAGTIIAHMADAAARRPSAAAKKRRVRTPAPPQLLADALVKANAEVYRTAQSRSEYRGMGSTVVVTLHEGARLYFAHAGDSRLYRLRDNALEQLTRDHSLVQDLVTRGLFTPEEARRSPAKNVVTRALGVDPVLEPDVGDTTVRTGDVYLLCSDGLTDVVQDEEIADLLGAMTDPAATVARLIERANTLGGPDNISVVIIRIDR